MSTTLRTAILYCGHARSISQTYENQNWFLWRHFPQIDFFCSMVDDRQADDMLLIRDKRPEAGWKMERVGQPEQEVPVEKTKFHSGYPRSTTPQNVMKQLWALNRCWEFFCEYAKPGDYDVIVRVRPDLAFMRLEMPRLSYPASHFIGQPLYKDAESEVENDAPMVNPGLCLSVWWSRWNGINDRFALLGHKAAEAYFTAYRKWPELHRRGCPLHPETIMRESLLMDGVQPDDTLACEFLTIRCPDAQHRDYYGIPCDATSIDIADYARSCE